MALNALRSGKIKVYSSYPIENGVFVTPSKMEAKNYAGNGKVFEKEVAIDEVAWIDNLEGQYAKISKEKPSDESARHSYFNAQSPNILHSNEIWGGGLAGGTLNGLETDEKGNIIGFNPAKFVAGFIAGAAGTKAVKLALQKNPNIRAKAERFVAQSGEFIKNELQNSDLPRHARHALENALGKTLTRALDNKLFIMPTGENAVKKEIVKEITNAKALQKEQKGIYNVAFNGKNATLIKKDLSRIDDALQNTLSFQKGYHNAAKDKGKGAEHIKMHLKEQEEGFITQSELLNLGKSVREYLAEFKEPFIAKNGARI